MPPSMQESYRLNQECDEETNNDPLLGDETCNTSHVKDVIVVVEPMKDPLIKKELLKGTQLPLCLHHPTAYTFYFSYLSRIAFTW